MTTRFLLGLPLLWRGRDVLPDGERSWAGWCCGTEPYLVAFETWGLPEPSAILDVGCAEGFLTCFYARLYPRATVVGLDRTPTAVARARTLATILGVPNVTFVEGDVRDLETVLPGRTFDLVTSRCTLRRLIQGKRSWPDQLPRVIRDEAALPIAVAIRRALEPRGVFVSTEGWKTAAELRCWADLLYSAGLFIDWDRSRAARLGAPDDRALWAMLAAHAGSGARPPSLEEAETFLVRAELETGPPSPALHGHAAQAVFGQLTSRRLLFGFQATFRRASGWRRELWDAGPLLVSFDYTNADDRELRFWPRCAAGILRSTLERDIRDLKVNGWEVGRIDRGDAFVVRPFPEEEPGE